VSQIRVHKQPRARRRAQEELADAGRRPLIGLLRVSGSGLLLTLHKPGKSTSRWLATDRD
jgi:hypothetical protein